LGCLEGKVAIVTGASGGLGRAFAMEMAADGAKVVGTGRNVERGEKTVSLIRENGGEAIFLTTDVTEEQAWQEVMDKTLETYGRLDSVINNAGDSVLKVIGELTLDDLHYLLRLNLEGSFLGTKYGMQTMGPEGGCVINVTVLSALAGSVHSSAYSAAKGALSHFSRAAALAGAPRNVRVNNIVPGVLFPEGELPEGATRVHGGIEGAQIFKDMIIAKTPLKRIGDPPDVGRAAVYLCSDAARMVTGIDVVVDGGRIARAP
jgi:NAD(P)-dependent dehydrogenase (short-subunit alcohol dehydrogenase family)